MSLTEECLKANQYDQVEGESATQFFCLFVSKSFKYAKAIHFKIW